MYSYSVDHLNVNLLKRTVKYCTRIVKLFAIPNLLSKTSEYDSIKQIIELGGKICLRKV